jgi:hypothetical protein
MPLSGAINMGAPEWLDNAYLFVSKNHSTISDDIEFKGYCIEFSVENLFASPIVSQDAIMRGFEISEMGNEETPDVVLSFTVRIPFSRKKWDWLGQFVGDDVWCKFTPGEAGTAKVEEHDGTLLDDGENDEDGDEDESDDPDTNTQTDDDELETGEGDDPELDKPEELEYEEASGKSGPKNLLAFHEKQLDAEAAPKRGPGRPRKPQGFDGPMNPTAF